MKTRILPSTLPLQASRSLQVLMHLTNRTSMKALTLRHRRKKIRRVDLNGMPIPISLPAKVPRRPTRPPNLRPVREVQRTFSGV